MNTAPSSAVEASQIRLRWTSPRVIEDTARAMVSELISRTNELTEVNGMSNTSVGARPCVLRWRSGRQGELSAHNSTQSEARNTHTPRVALELPVRVWQCVCSGTAVFVWAGVGGTRLQPP